MTRIIRIAPGGPGKSLYPNFPNVSEWLRARRTVHSGSKDQLFLGAREESFPRREQYGFIRKIRTQAVLGLWRKTLSVARTLGYEEEKKCSRGSARRAAPHEERFELFASLLFRQSVTACARSWRARAPRPAKRCHRSRITAAAASPRSCDRVTCIERTPSSDARRALPPTRRSDGAPESARTTSTSRNA